MTLKACADCGELSHRTRCDECSPSPTFMRGSSPAERGYNSAWQRLSKRARALQPFCSDCGTEDNLTCDHLPSAWERKEKGLPIRLQDVDVLCSECNVKKGSSRPGSNRAAIGDTRGIGPFVAPGGPGGKAKSSSDRNRASQKSKWSNTERARRGRNGAWNGR